MKRRINAADIRRVDRTGMLDVSLDLARQVLEGWRLPRPAVGGGEPRAVTVLGMGGSAIGGDILSSILAERGGPPVTVHRGFGVPPGIGRGTLVFAVSYSGETEETLSAARSALRRGCRLVTLSSGGRLRRIGRGRSRILLPAGFRPRSALAYMLLPMMGVLQDLGAAGFEEEVREAASVLSRMRAVLRPESEAPGNIAKAAAAAFVGRLPAVLSGPFLEPAARRWRAQLAENAKALSLGGTLPEMCHNDLVAWSADPAAAGCAAVLLRDSREDRRLSRRRELARKLGLDRAGRALEVRSRGRGAVARLLSSVLVGDLASIYLAVLRGVDPAPVEAIDRLKRALAGGGR